MVAHGRFGGGEPREAEILRGVVLRAQMGDVVAKEALLTWLWPRLLELLRARWTRTERRVCEPEDLCQLACIEVMRCLGHFRGEGLLRWASVVARRAARQAVRELRSKRRGSGRIMLMSELDQDTPRGKALVLLISAADDPAESALFEVTDAIIAVLDGRWPNPRAREYRLVRGILRSGEHGELVHRVRRRRPRRQPRCRCQAKSDEVGEAAP